ncbi:MAG: LptA/OstA family protein [Gammaproteobacteria bacterium]
MWKAYIFVSARAGVFLAAAACFTVAAAAAEQIEVRGDRAEYSADGRRAEFDGNVVLQSGGATVYAARLIVSVFAEGNHYQVSGTPARAECGDCATVSLQLLAPEILLRDDAERLFSADGGLTLCAGESCARGRLRAGRAEWRRATGEVFLRGAPVDGFWLPGDGGAAVTMRAAEVNYAHPTGEVHLRGDALVARGGEEIRGDSIMFNVKTGAINASGGDDSRVRGVFGGDE